MMNGKNILVTGGAGSVGRLLISNILDREPNVVRIFDNNEPALANAKTLFDDDDRCRFLHGDIREKMRLKRATEDIDIIIHAAAMKHVDISEYNPFEAVKTNVVGLQNVVDTAIDEDVNRIVFTSSDKSVNPENTMGTTKLLGEKLMTAGNKYRGTTDLHLSSVRFGNVLGSSQSVIQLFEEQIANGGPVQLTDERMTRFFITPEQVSDLIMTAVTDQHGGEVFVRKMTAIRIEDLAETMIARLAPEYGYNPETIDIEIIGRRIGETFHERIMTERETHRVVSNGDIYAIQPETGANGYLTHPGLDEYTNPDSIIRSSADAPKIGKDEIANLLDKTTYPQ